MIYLLGLTFLLFLNYRQIKDILIFIDDDLKNAGPDMKVSGDILMKNSLELIQKFSKNKVSLAWVSSSSNPLENLYWTFRKNSIELIELSSINKVSLV